MRQLSFKDAIREAQEQLLEDDRCFLIGEGVGDPKNVFGTTTGLKDKFPARVFDSPISENGVTGVCIGAAINGLKPILVHQRIDFSLYSMDQVVNNAAKWNSMFGGKINCPIVIRMIVGRGWGQGNQHSQNLTSLYAHIPGLKVFCPSNAKDAKGLLIEAVNDPNPVIFIEHRWLYETTSDVPIEMYRIPQGTVYVDPGHDITIVASGYAYREAFKAREFLQKQGVSVELIDLRTIKPLPIWMIKQSVMKTGKLVVVDDCWKTCGLAGEIIASVAEDLLGVCYRRVTYPDYPSASSPALTEAYYNGPADIFAACMEILPDADLDITEVDEYQDSRVHDVPDKNFRGPF